MSDTPQRPLRASLKAGDAIQVPIGKVTDEHGQTVRILYEDIDVVAGSCRVEILSPYHFRIAKAKQRAEPVLQNLRQFGKLSE